MNLDQKNVRKAIALLGALALVAYLVVYISQTYLSPLGYATYALMGAAGLGTLAFVAFAKRQKFGSTQYRLLVTPVLIAGLASAASLNFFGDRLTVPSPEERAQAAYLTERDASSRFYTSGVSIKPVEMETGTYCGLNALGTNTAVTKMPPGVAIWGDDSLCAVTYDDSKLSVVAVITRDGKTSKNNLYGDSWPESSPGKRTISWTTDTTVDLYVYDRTKASDAKLLPRGVAGPDTFWSIAYHAS